MANGTGTQFGVTPDGFVLKAVDQILADEQSRARQMFGDDVDLSSGSPLRKILDAVAWQAHDLWKGMERQYYANFVTTGDGPDLDLLGTDLGVTRWNLYAQGQVTLTLKNGQPGRSYTLSEGTVVQTAGPSPLLFRTLEPAGLTANVPVQTVSAEATVRGVAGNIAAGQLTQLNAESSFLLNLGTATVSPKNDQPFAGGEILESDNDYRARLVGYPRTIWTVDRLSAAVKDVDGVRDCRVFDPLGGVDVSQSYFNVFAFGQRTFSLDRRLYSPYYFDVVVATQPGWPWRTTLVMTGVFERVLDTIRDLRPVSIFPNVVPANEVEIGLRATLVIEPGHDRDAILGHLLAGLRQYVSALNLGSGVLHSDVVVLMRSVVGVADVQNVHLRRCPAQFAKVNFGGALFRQPIESAIGENISLAPDEIPFFVIDSKLIDVEVTSR